MQISQFTIILTPNTALFYCFPYLGLNQLFSNNHEVQSSFHFSQSVYNPELLCFGFIWKNSDCGSVLLQHSCYLELSSQVQSCVTPLSFWPPLTPGCSTVSRCSMITPLTHCSCLLQATLHPATLYFWTSLIPHEAPKWPFQRFAYSSAYNIFQ